MIKVIVALVLALAVAGCSIRMFTYRDSASLERDYNVFSYDRED